MSGTPEVMFHRTVRAKYPRGWADFSNPDTLERCDLGPNEVAVLALVREALNLALRNAKLDPLHHHCGPWHFDYIDAEESSAESFSSEDYSFIGMTVAMAKDTFRLASRVRSSRDVWDAIGLDRDRTTPDSFEFLLIFVALMFIAAHEYCHHVLGHQPHAVAQGDARTASLRGNLQAQTREVGADGYAAMHLLEHVIVGAFRVQAVDMLSLKGVPGSDQERVLFLVVLVAVAATWFRNPPALLDSESVYLLLHPPRAVRLHGYMEHAHVWCRGSRPALIGIIDGQLFANLMYFVGLAVCETSEDADSSSQNAFMRSPEGQAYAKALFANLDIHKGLMGGNPGA